MDNNPSFLYFIGTLSLSCGVGSKYAPVDGVICFGLVTLIGIIFCSMLNYLNGGYEKGEG